MVSKFTFLNDINDKVSDSLHDVIVKAENLCIKIKKTSFLKCVRCWKFEEDVKEVGELCLRCKQTLSNNE